MSDFFKQLNGQFGTIYRKNQGGKGYVFQDRFKSMLIQDNSYLLMVIAYVLNNPVRARLVDNFIDYKWSSALFYSLIEAAKANDLEPNKYLKYLFEKFPYAKSPEDIFNLLPMNVSEIDLKK